MADTVSTGEPQVIELGGPDGILELDVSAPPTVEKPQSQAASPAPLAKPSVNFGPGVELLMNDKRREKSPRQPDIELSDVTGIDAELDQLSKPRPPSKSGLLNQVLMGSAAPTPEPGKPVGGPPEEGSSQAPAVVKSADTSPEPGIGKATASTVAESGASNRTWDGFAPFGDVPVDPDNAPQPPPLSEEETLRLKFKTLRDLERLEKKGVTLSKQYTMESSLQEMQGEYETIVAEREKKASAKFQGRMLMAAVTGLEFLNNRFDPFDVKLDGWAEQVGENLEDYDEIFGELHEKYKSKAKMAPELKLLFQLGGSAIMVHMTNSMFKSAVPGMDDIMKQNPELMQQFSQAAVNSMGASNPGFAGFMQDVAGSGPPRRPRPPPPNSVAGPPPPPMRTQAPRSARIQPRPRPDIEAARGGVDIQDNQEVVGEAPRAEMRGPRDLGDILSGLKTRTLEVPARSSEPADQSSTISVQELKEMSNAKAPPRSKRRGGSTRNTVSLEL